MPSSRSVAEPGRRRYRFDGDGRDLVIRVGRHVDDFRSDLAVAAHRSPQLPIPEVVHVDSFGEEHCCISAFVPGTPLESCSATEWQAVIPSLVDAMEAMRRCRPDRRVRAWSDTLLAADGVHTERRLSGWRDRISRAPAAVEALGDAMTQLRSIDLDIDLGRVAPTLTHGDLINRNVHVNQGTVSGIFDWGCMRWGDHLYDLAWFEFWSSWYPDLDIGLLQAELERRWRDDAYEVRTGTNANERVCSTSVPTT